MQQLPMAWMWAVDDEVFGLSIDLETRTLRWFVHAGCACDFDDAYTKQSPPQFLARGVPGGVADPPEDVLAAIQRSVAWLATSETPSEPQAQPQPVVEVPAAT